MDHIPKIIIKTIHPNNQRFLECGDYFYDIEDDTLTIFVSKMPRWESELAVAIHEAVEFCKCLAEGVDQTDIDAFDKKFYQEHNEPGVYAGDDPKAPYFEQHIAATFVEKEVCEQLKLDWQEHDKNCDEA